jgi:hypothetical protein
VHRVLSQLGDEIGPALLSTAHGVLRQAIAFGVFHIAELAHRFASRVGVGHALLHELTRAHVEVEPQLVVEISAKARRRAPWEPQVRPQPAHYTRSSTLKTASA